MYIDPTPGLQTMVMGRPPRGRKPYTFWGAVITLLVVGAIPAFMLGSQFIGPWADYRTHGLAVLQREFAAFPPCAASVQPASTRTISGPWVDLSIERDYAFDTQCSGNMTYYATLASQAGWSSTATLDPAPASANFYKSTDGYSLTFNVECDGSSCYLTMSTPTPTVTGSYNGDLAIFAVGILIFCLVAYAALTNHPFWGRP